MKTLYSSILAMALCACVGYPVTSGGRAVRQDEGTLHSPLAVVSSSPTPRMSTPLPESTQTPDPIASAMPSPRATGILSFSVKWPRRIAVIPDATEFIRLSIFPGTVASDSILLVHDIPRSTADATVTTTASVPSGDIYALAEAMDASASVVASGGITVEIKPYAIAYARITMAAVER